MTTLTLSPTELETIKEALNLMRAFATDSVSDEHTLPENLRLHWMSIADKSKLLLEKLEKV